MTYLLNSTGHKCQIANIFILHISRVHKNNDRNSFFPNIADQTHSPECSKHTLFQTKMAKIYILYQAKVATYLYKEVESEELNPHDTINVTERIEPLMH